MRRICARAEIGHAVTRGEILDPFANGLHNASPLLAEREGQLHRIKSRAVIGIDKVETCRALADQGFAGAGLAWLHGHTFENFGTAGLVNENAICVAHG